MLPFHFIAHNMGTQEFSDYSGFPIATIKDWRKRHMMQIGQPHPERGDRWLYSRMDAMILSIAKMLTEDGRTSWNDAHWMGRIIGGHLEGRFTYRAAKIPQSIYDGRFVVFYDRGHEKLTYQFGMAELDLVSNLANPVIRLIDTEWILERLDQKYRDGLESLTTSFAAIASADVES